MLSSIQMLGLCDLKIILSILLTFLLIIRYDHKILHQMKHSPNNLTIIKITLGSSYTYAINVYINVKLIAIL